MTVEGDWPAPGPHRNHLDDDRIAVWFGQNCDLDAPHPKFVPLPLGIAAPHWPHGNQAALLRAHRALPPVEDRPAMAHASFHLTLSHPDRMAVWQVLQDRPGIVFEPCRLSPEALWLRHADHAFALSPRGAGLDCHRTWEALVLGTIPIVRQSTLDPVFDGLPVVSVRDWQEVTPDAMAAWQEDRQEAFTPALYRRLTAAHWTEQILAAAKAARTAAPAQGGATDGTA